jgi:curli biogenesis system outer membrane secretion channel CsgG
MQAFRALPFLLLAVAACNAPKQLDPKQAELVQRASAVAPLPDDRQPVLMIRVEDNVGGGVNSGLRGLFGGDASTAPPTEKALERRIEMALNNTKRFRVVSFDELREMKRLQSEGLVKPDAERIWALSPHYSVTCTVIECNEQSSSGQRWNVPIVGWKNSESVATVTMAVKVTALKDSRVVWNGEVKGKQSSAAKSFDVNVGFIRTENNKANSPTLDDAVKMALCDLVVTLADNVPELPPASPSGG